MATSKQGVQLDDETDNDLKAIVVEHHDSVMDKHPKDSFLSPGLSARLY